jgi:hypothetical protein
MERSNEMDIPISWTIALLREEAYEEKDEVQAMLFLLSIYDPTQRPSDM